MDRDQLEIFVKYTFEHAYKLGKHDCKNGIYLCLDTLYKNYLLTNKSRLTSINSTNECSKA